MKLKLTANLLNDFGSRFEFAHSKYFILIKRKIAKRQMIICLRIKYNLNAYIVCINIV